MTWQQWVVGKNGRRAARLAAFTSVAVLASGAAAANTFPAAAGHGSTTPEAAAVARAAVLTADSPAGFWYGTDSSTMKVPGPAPYREPVIGGSYGGYIGMAGNWANLAGCHQVVVWSFTNSAQAKSNYTWHHRGIGTGVYYFIGGPGVDPHYNGTRGETYQWGE